MIALALVLAAGPDPEVARLNAELLASRSATAVLAKWCGDLHLADPPRIRAEVTRAHSLTTNPEVRRRLKVGRREMLGSRRVRLMCGDHLLSEATNWYVPARLTPEMNAALDSGDTPFGTAIRPLAPTRRTLSARVLWKDRRRAPLATVLRHHAIVLDGKGRPLADVVENYQRVLATGRD